MLDFYAAVLHSDQASYVRTTYSFFSNGERILGATEDVNDLDGLACFFGLSQRGIDTLAKQRLPSIAWVDRNDVVALSLHIDSHKMTGTIRIGRDANDGYMMILLKKFQAIIHIWNSGYHAYVLCCS